MEHQAKQRCGFVGVVGLPNAGKSTLVNALVGEKVSIVSPKVQTTRRRILGIAQVENSQILLLDTPGLFRAQKTLERAMVAAAQSVLQETEMMVHIVDASQKNAAAMNRQICADLPNGASILVLNKVDKVDKPSLLSLSQALYALHDYRASFMISALNGKGVPDVLRYLAQALPEGPWIYPSDQTTDMPMRLMAAEITREKVFLQIHEEIPYAVHVETEEWENFENGSIRIAQVIVVQKESQKAIILGKGGARIKAIGSAARTDIAAITGCDVHLKIFVKVQEDWAERSENLSFYGLDRSS